MEASPTPAPGSRRSGAIALVALALTALWLVLAKGDLSSWAVGAVTVALATWVARALAAPVPAAIRWWAAAYFLGHFLADSLVSGVAVGRRALALRPGLRPTLVRFESRLPDEGSRVFLANAISLLPGTLTCGLVGAHLTLHVLDRGLYDLSELRQLEDRVAHLFGAEPLPVLGEERDAGPAGEPP